MEGCAVKRVVALMLICLWLALPGHAGTDVEELDLAPSPTPEAAEPAALSPLSAAPLETAVPVKADCAAVLLAEQDSGQVIFEMNPDVPRPVASVTKVMTILLSLEMLDAGRLSLSDEVTISRASAGMGGSQALLDVGERQSVATLLECMIVGSANDAAVALAEAMYGTEEACVDRMNARAAELGMANTHFVNCTGLPAEGQHTTARDVAVMSRQVFAHPTYFEFSKTWMDDIDHRDGRVTQLVNTNKLLRLCDGCDGGKTGSTREAGYCVTATARRGGGTASGGMRLVAVVLGADSGAERFAIAQRMLDHGFANYRHYPVAKRGTRVKGRLPVIGGAAEGVALQLGSDLTLLLNRGDEQRVRLSPDLPESIPAPVLPGAKVGSVDVSLDGRTLARIPVVTAEGIEARGLSSGIDRFWKLWPMVTAQSPG